MNKPTPKREGEVLVWRRADYLPTVRVGEPMRECNEVTSVVVEELFQAQRLCEGGDLKWVKVFPEEIERARRIEDMKRYEDEQVTKGYMALEGKKI